MKIYISEGIPPKGELIPVPKTSLRSYSGLTGRPYMLYMQVQIKDKSKLNQQNFEKFKKILYDKYHTKVDYFEVRENKAGKQYALMTVTGYGPEILLAVLPELMPILGLTVVAITVYYIIKKHPFTSVMMFIGLLILIWALFGRKLGMGLSMGE